jgi:hypothetical protein
MSDTVTIVLAIPSFVHGRCHDLSAMKRKLNHGEIAYT